MVRHLLDTVLSDHFGFWVCPKVVNHQGVLHSPSLSTESYFFQKLYFFFHFWRCEYINYDLFSGNIDITSCHELRRPGSIFYCRFMQLKHCNCLLGINLNVPLWCVQATWHGAAYIAVSGTICKSLVKVSNLIPLNLTNMWVMTCPFNVLHFTNSLLTQVAINCAFHSWS